MKVALYQGTSFVSLTIRWFTRSRFSHAALFCDSATEEAGIQMVKSGCEFSKLHYFSLGSVVEAWKGGVKNSPTISTLHNPGTHVQLMSPCHPETGELWPLSRVEEEHFLVLCDKEYIGRPYDFGDIVRFLTRQRGHPHGSVFCSFLVDVVMRKCGRPPLARTEGWRVTPNDLWQTPWLTPFRETITR